MDTIQGLRNFFKPPGWRAWNQLDASLAIDGQDEFTAYLGQVGRVAGR